MMIMMVMIMMIKLEKSNKKYNNKLTNYLDFYTS